MKTKKNDKVYYAVNVFWGMVKGPFPSLKKAIKEAQFWSELERCEFKVMTEVADSGAL